MERWFFLNSKKEGMNQTEGEVLLAVAEIKKVDPQTLLKYPPLRQSAFYLIEHFFEIYQGEPVSFENIAAWERVRKIKLSNFEVDCILAIDRIRLKCQANQT